jgi:hypothetical protein
MRHSRYEGSYVKAENVIAIALHIGYYPHHIRPIQQANPRTPSICIVLRTIFIRTQRLHSNSRTMFLRPCSCPSLPEQRKYPQSVKNSTQDAISNNDTSTLLRKLESQTTVGSSKNEDKTAYPAVGKTNWCRSSRSIGGSACSTLGVYGMVYRASNRLKKEKCDNDCADDSMAIESFPLFHSQYQINSFLDCIKFTRSWLMLVCRTSQIPMPKATSVMMREVTWIPA